MRVVVTSTASRGGQVMIFRQPGGRPASRNARPSAQKQRGVSSEALRTVVFPAARAQAAARTPKTYGAFLIIHMD